MIKLSRLILVTAITLTLTFPTHIAFGYHFPITVPNPTPSPGDSFGWATSISGNKVLVGAYGDGTGASGAGSAYLFNATTGTLLEAYHNPTPALNDIFGYSVSISGNSVLVGAYGDDAGAENAGAAHLFDVTTGNLLRTFNNPTPVQNDSMGFSVSHSANKVLLGAPLDDTGFQNAGTAYLFDATTGALLYTINNPAPASGDHFGYSVFIDGTNILIGAFLDDAGATDAGSAYLFDVTTGNLLRTFNNPAPASGDQFGRSVSISGTNILIGALLDDVGATDAGSAYLFDATTGALLYTINNPAPASGDQFGRSVSISDNQVVISANTDDAGAHDAGTAYLYDITSSLILLHTFNNPSPSTTDDFFGESVSISGSSLVIGAYGDDLGATNTGSAYLFTDTSETSSTAQGQVQILGTCGLSFPNGNNVSYGNLTPNSVSSEIKLNMTNSGSVNAVLAVSGTNWLDSGNNSVMLVNRTHYNVTSGVSYALKSPLQTFDQTVTNSFIPSVILQTFWQLQASLLNPSFTGSATQTMDFTVSC